MRLLIVCCVALVLAVRTEATVLIGADLGELSRDAVAIARGRVVAIDGRWGDGRRTIETIVTLEVERYLKGSLGETVEFRVPGGVLGRFQNIVVGAPEFTVDERVIVFLGARGPSMPFVLGLSQGVFRVAHSGDADWVSSPVFVPTSGGAARLVRGDTGRQPLALADFEQRVRGFAGALR